MASGSIDKIDLLKSLLNDVSNLAYNDAIKLDALRRRAKMILTQALGADSHYILDFEKIRFYPLFPDLRIGPEQRRNCWDTAKSQCVNLINTGLEEVRLTCGDEAEQVANHPDSISKNNQDVFIVHGHDEAMKQSVARVLEKLDLKPIILHEKPDQGRTIIEKFIEYSNVRFAVVLFSPDDMGHSIADLPVKAKARARQNVVLELGFFLGKLGRDSVVVLYKDVQDFDMPSDYSGVLFKPYEGSGWQFELVRELHAKGFKVDSNKLI